METTVVCSLHTTIPPILSFFHYCGECVIERAKVANNIIKKRGKVRGGEGTTIMLQSAEWVGVRSMGNTKWRVD